MVEAPAEKPAEPPVVAAESSSTTTKPLSFLERSRLARKQGAGPADASVSNIATSQPKIFKPTVATLNSQEETLNNI